MIISMAIVLGIAAGCTTQQVAYKERLEDAKGYAFYVCLTHMSELVDSLSVINRDYSGSYFVQFGSLSPDEIGKIQEYVDKECMNYWHTPQDTEGHMIAYSVWKFCHSAELDAFIRHVLMGDADKKKAVSK